MLSARVPALIQNPLPFISIYSLSKIAWVGPRNGEPVRGIGPMSMVGTKEWDVSQAGCRKGPPGMDVLCQLPYSSGTGLNEMYAIPGGLDLLKSGN
jgi:hypothetical protein